MAVPTSYTDSEFKKYIRDEVLAVIFTELGWVDAELPPAIGHVYTIQGAGTDGTWNGYVDTEELPVTIPSGGTVVLNGVSRTTRAIAYKGETRILINGAGLTFGESYSGSHTTAVAESYDPMSVNAYDAILNETMLRLGITTLVGYTDIKKLRLFGRREAWRHAMWATAGDYDFTTPNQVVERALVYEQSKEMFLREDRRIKDGAELSSRFDSQPDYFTEAGEIEPVWS